jgi:ABC-type polysaccharide/polyol phosphate transport system ATPase subunit
MIRATGVTIEYNASSYRYDSFKEWVLRGFGRRDSVKKVVALNKVDIHAKRGESIALLGHNGCGKSTLMKAIAGVIIPISGRIELHGRVAALIELGAGFDGNLSGRENIRLSCMLMGLTSAEVAEKQDGIIHFSELQDFIDIPLKNYSSGMYARLGFACATAVDPDILLIDEVLSVGDTNFGRKCLSRIQDLKEKGTTVVLVSHDMNAVRNFCDRGYVFENGRLRFEGAIGNSIMTHYKIMDQRYARSLVEPTGAENTKNSGIEEDSEILQEPLPEVHSESRFVQNGQTADELDAARPFAMEFTLRTEFTERFKDPVSIGIGISTMRDIRVGGGNNLEMKVPFPRKLAREKGKVVTTFSFPRGIPELAGGEYKLYLGVHDSNLQRNIGTREIGIVRFTNSKLGLNKDNDIFSIVSYVGAIDFK